MAKQQDKPNPLAQALNKAKTTSPMPKATEEQQELQNKPLKTTSREGRKTVIAYIDPAGARELKILSADTNKTQQELFTEAINDLLIKHGKKPLA